jgi:hypothetical protein
MHDPIIKINEELLCLAYVMKSSKSLYFGGTPCIYLQGLQAKQETVTKLGYAVFLLGLLLP